MEVCLFSSLDCSSCRWMAAGVCGDRMNAVGFDVPSDSISMSSGDPTTAWFGLRVRCIRLGSIGDLCVWVDLRS